jgi:hypothetical protein
MKHASTLRSANEPGQSARALSGDSPQPPTLRRECEGRVVPVGNPHYSLIGSPRALNRGRTLLDVPHATDEPRPRPIA